jgi:hypothetical protein
VIEARRELTLGYVRRQMLPINKPQGKHHG